MTGHPPSTKPGLLLLLLLLLAISESGCVSFTGAGSIREEMRPKELYIGKDDSLAIKVTSSYYRDAFFRNDDKITTVPLQRKQADRFVIIPESWISKSLNNTKQASRKSFPIDLIRLSEEGYNGGIDIIPKRYLAREATDADLPESFGTSPTAHPLTQSVEVMVDGETVSLDISKIRIESYRSHTRWWVYPVAAPIVVVEGAAAIAGGCMAIVFFPLIGIGYALNSFSN